MLTGQTTQAFPLMLLVLFPLPPNFHCWLTKPEEFIISETYGRAECAKQGRLFFFLGLSDSETLAYNQPIIMVTEDWVLFFHI